MKKILNKVCHYYGIKPEVLNTKLRNKELVKARKIFANLAIEKFGMEKKEEIAKMINRDVAILYAYSYTNFTKLEMMEIEKIRGNEILKPDKMAEKLYNDYVCFLDAENALKCAKMQAVALYEETGLKYWKKVINKL